MLDWVVTPLTESPTSDVLRLVAVPIFAWAAYRDYDTRRVPNRTWLPLAVLGVALLVWDAIRVLNGEIALGFGGKELFFVRIALSLGLVGSIGYLFYWFGGFGGADAKALLVLAVLFPTFPTYILPLASLPLEQTTVGVFSLTILSNTVVVGAIYPLAMAARNAVGGHIATAMLIGKPIPAERATEEYGSLLETPEGFTRRGLDLDALRMYLQWRGCTFATLRENPDRFRDPDSLPETPNPPGDGSIGDEPIADDSPDDGSRDDGPAEDGETDREPITPEQNDDWGAEAFLDDIEGTAYGTTPEALRDGLDVLVAKDEVWLTPGTPFLVPMFGGLLVSIVYGDLLVTLISMLV